MKTLLILSLLLLSACATPMLNGSLANGDLTPYQLQKKPQPPPEVCDGVCGYVTTRSFAEKTAYFTDCKTKKVSEKICTDKFNEMMSARLVLAYPETDWNRVGVWCKAEPKECDLTTLAGANKIEDQVKLIQEQIIDGRAQAKREAAEERDKENRKAAVRAWGLQQMNKQTSCTHSQIGNTVFTNCR